MYNFIYLNISTIIKEYKQKEPIQIFQMVSHDKSNQFKQANATAHDLEDWNKQIPRPMTRGLEQANTTSHD